MQWTHFNYARYKLCPYVVHVNKKNYLSLHAMLEISHRLEEVPTEL